jgi:hypothetical protein
MHAAMSRRSVYELNQFNGYTLNNLTAEQGMQTVL